MLDLQLDELIRLLLYDQKVYVYKYGSNPEEVIFKGVVHKLGDMLELEEYIDLALSSVRLIYAMDTPEVLAIGIEYITLG